MAQTQGRLLIRLLVSIPKMIPTQTMQPSNQTQPYPTPISRNDQNECYAFGA